jgi:hypothetical protein
MVIERNLRGAAADDRLSNHWVPVHRQNQIGARPVDSVAIPRQENACWRAHRGDSMLAPICCGHRAVALENLALRHQLAVCKRRSQRPPLRRQDRLVWVMLAHAWRDWRSAVVMVQPDTVVRWHRSWLRRRWRQRSKADRPGRPCASRIPNFLAESRIETDRSFMRETP